MTKDRSGTSGGRGLTDELIERLADEAERGYEPEALARRARRGRPPIGSSAARPIQVRLEPELEQALANCADAEQTTTSDIVRRALREYLDVPAPRPKGRPKPR